MRLFQITFSAGTSSQHQKRSYGSGIWQVQALIAAAALALTLLAAIVPVRAQESPVKLVALGDSLTAGLGLPAPQAFPARLSQALKAKGIAVEVSDAGVSGDTASAGLGRLDWAVPDGTQAVIVELGANDALRGVNPSITRGALDEIVRRLKERGIEVLLVGMAAPRNLGSDYAQQFDSIYPELAQKYGVLLYPFFLDGVVTDVKLNQRDGMHPNAEGVDVIVERILPKVEELVTRVRQKSPD